MTRAYGNVQQIGDMLIKACSKYVRQESGNAHLYSMTLPYRLPCLSSRCRMSARIESDKSQRLHGS